jgi:hypothetical protein
MALAAIQLGEGRLGAAGALLTQGFEHALAAGDPATIAGTGGVTSSGA